MKTLKNTKLDDLEDFSTIAESIYKYLKKTWKCKVLPKGYKKFIKDYEEYDGMEELDHEAITKSFKGYDDATAGSQSFPIKIALPHTAYNANEQSINPLQTLIGAILGHGMMIGHRRAEIKAITQLERQLRDFKSEVRMSEASGEKIDFTFIDENMAHRKEFGI